MLLGYGTAVDGIQPSLLYKTTEFSHRITLKAMASAGSSAPVVRRQLLDAIRAVETGPRSTGTGVKGDSGKALGPYQIWKVYHDDAAAVDKSLDDYSKCLTSKDYSERVIQAYMRRYATRSRLGRDPTDEDIARIHNGGPNGYKNDKTVGYWGKVSAYL